MEIQDYITNVVRYLLEQKRGGNHLKTIFAKRQIYKYYKEWSEEYSSDFCEMVLFFYFCCKTGIHLSEGLTFYVKSTKQEKSGKIYLIEEKTENDYTDSSDEEDEDEDFWINEKILKDCYPELV